MATIKNITFNGSGNLVEVAQLDIGITPTAARDALELGTAATPTFTGLNLTDKLFFGSSSAQIGHDGTSWLFRNYLGSMVLQQAVNSGLGSLRSYDSAGVTRTSLRWGGAIPGIELRYNGSARLITTDAGITVTGAVTETDSGWLTPTLTNTWIQNDSTNYPVQYRKVGNIVYLRGTLKNNTFTNNNNSVAFTLPAGYRPSIGSAYFRTGGGGFLSGSAAVIIASDGTVKVTDLTSTAAPVLASLDGISFRVD